MNSENLKHFQMSLHIQSLVWKRTTHNKEEQNVFNEFLCVCSILRNKTLLALPVLLSAFTTIRKTESSLPSQVHSITPLHAQKEPIIPNSILLSLQPKNTLEYSPQKRITPTLSNNEQSVSPSSTITTRTLFSPMEERIHRGGMPMPAGIRRNYPQSLILWNQNN